MMPSPSDTWTAARCRWPANTESQPALPDASEVRRIHKPEAVKGRSGHAIRLL